MLHVSRLSGWFLLYKCFFSSLEFICLFSCQIIRTLALKLEMPTFSRTRTGANSKVGPRFYRSICFPLVSGIMNKNERSQPTQEDSEDSRERKRSTRSPK